MRVQRGEIRIKDSRTLSTGASMWFLGPQGSQRSATFLPSGPSFGTNVDAANPNEDVAGGQSETAVAADGDNIVATWNDANGFFFKDSTLPEAQATGVGISNDGGASFTDYGGLHNPDPNQQWFGDPSVVTIDHDHFIASSFWLPSNNATDFCASRITMAVEVITIDSGGTVTFGNPLVAVDGGVAVRRQFVLPGQGLSGLRPGEPDPGHVLYGLQVRSAHEFRQWADRAGPGHRPGQSDQALTQ
jgi:hypothetical protein